jgi:hypothetical protein
MVEWFLFSGVTNQYIADQHKPVEQRYIHSVVTGPNGGIIIATFQPALAKFIHQVKCLFVDMTFKQAIGDLNELELAIWEPSINRCMYHTFYPNLIFTFC